jgi:hypothetical protein
MLAILDAAQSIIDRTKESAKLVREIHKVDIASGGRIDSALKLAHEICNGGNGSGSEPSRVYEICKLYDEVIEGMLSNLSQDMETILTAEVVVNKERAHFSYNRKRILANRRAVQGHRQRVQSQFADSQTLFDTTAQRQYLNSEPSTPDIVVTPATDEDARRARAIAERLNASAAPTLFDAKDETE